jgi:hypothetical protein
MQWGVLVEERYWIDPCTFDRWRETELLVETLCKFMSKVVFVEA